MPVYETLDELCTVQLAVAVAVVGGEGGQLELPVRHGGRVRGDGQVVGQVADISKSKSRCVFGIFISLTLRPV